MRKGNKLIRRENGSNDASKVAQGLERQAHIGDEDTFI